MRKDWCQSHTGREVGLFMAPEEIDIRDIAQALGNICRFMGHTREFYSVAQHCVIASNAVGDYFFEDTPEKRMTERWALLHDAAEAYFGDIPRPLKRQLPGIKSIEEDLLKAVALRFGLPWPMPELVGEIDNRLLFTEKRDVLAVADMPWNWQREPFDFTITPLNPECARNQFRARFEEPFGDWTKFFAEASCC